MGLYRRFVLRWLLMPVRWAWRGVRGPGRERTAVVQAVKAAVAAMAAWVLASVVFQLPQPFLAPYAAVFLVEVTVYRSLWSAAQQVGAVLGAVLLAAGVVQIVPSQTAAMGVVVAAGLLLGRWRGFGTSGVWVGVTALILVSYGTAGQSDLLLDRMLETLLGAAVGLAVNMLIFPPLYPRDPANATTTLAEQLSGVLRDIAEDFRADKVTDRSQAWIRRIDHAETLGRDAEEAAGWTRESARLNHRRSAGATAVETSRWQTLLAAERAARPHLRQLAEAVHTTTEQRAPFPYPAPAARGQFADLFDATADLLHTRAGLHDHDPREAEKTGRSALAELERLVAETPHDSLDLTLGLGTMLLPARKAFEALLP